MSTILGAALAGTVMYGASISKAVFAQYVLLLVDDGKLDLDSPIKAYLPKFLPDYPKYTDLAGDPRWETITPRRLLTHSSGLVMLTNSGVGARVFPPPLNAALGDLGMPWTWEYNPVLPVAP